MLKIAEKTYTSIPALLFRLDQGRDILVEPVEIFIFSSLKKRHFMGKLPKQVLIPQKKTSCHVFKMSIFSKFFGDVMSHIIR